jgi:CheY-like chemotaxis protein
MLTSGEREGDLDRCRGLGIATYLNKPVRRSDLLRALTKALTNQSSIERVSESVSLLRRPSEKVRNESPVRILLAEDNVINQHVARSILHKAGHLIIVASNGREALLALRRQTFDLVLMDVQMPEVDGFEATAAIRENELGTDRRLPIVAMTAHAMKGDRERCLAAGMDGYISKPISAGDLLELVDKYSGRIASVVM